MGMREALELLGIVVEVLGNQNAFKTATIERVENDPQPSTWAVHTHVVIKGAHCHVDFTNLTQFHRWLGNMVVLRS